MFTPWATGWASPPATTTTTAGPDLYVTTGARTRCGANNGDGTFSDASEKTGTGDPGWGTSASFVDYDRDGKLDLYVANYLRFDYSLHVFCPSPSSTTDYCGPAAFDGQSDRLYRNRGDGSFEDVSESSGIDAATGKGLGVAAADFDGNGWLDVYVANDKVENLLWLNRGDGTFREVALAAGCALNREGRPESSMGVDAADFDDDGDEDLFLTHLTRETNTVYVNDSTGVFSDKSTATGLGPASWKETGWGTAWLDYDNDGLLDVFVATARSPSSRSRLEAGDPFPLRQTNKLFRNEGNGRFADVSKSSGPAMDILEVSRGAAFGDVDNDGDTDVVILNNASRVSLLSNEVGATRSWLGLRLVGTEGGRDMLGARVEIVLPGGRLLLRRARSDGSYVSANDPRVLAGLGDARSCRAGSRALARPEHRGVDRSADRSLHDVAPRHRRSRRRPLMARACLVLLTLVALTACDPGADRAQLESLGEIDLSGLQTSSDTLRNVIERVSRERKGIVFRAARRDADENTSEEEQAFHVAYPVWIGKKVQGVAALEISSRAQTQLQLAMRQLQWGVAWLQNWLLRQSSRPARAGTRMTTVLELAGLTLEEPRFKSASTAVATELASRFKCDRVSIGFLVRGQVKVRALSHSSQFTKQMNLIRSIGMAMGEAVDQQATLHYPAPHDAPDRVLKAHEQLARNHGVAVVCSVPFVDHEGHAFGALMFERATSDTFDDEDLELCESVAALVGPILDDKRKNDRLLITKARDSLWTQIKRLIGPRHALRKLIALIVASPWWCSSPSPTDSTGQRQDDPRGGGPPRRRRAVPRVCLRGPGPWWRHREAGAGHLRSGCPRPAPGVLPLVERTGTVRHGAPQGDGRWRPCADERAEQEDAPGRGPDRLARRADLTRHDRRPVRRVGRQRRPEPVPGCAGRGRPGLVRDCSAGVVPGQGAGRRTEHRPDPGGSEG